MRIPAKGFSHPRGAWGLLFLLAPAIPLAQESTRERGEPDPPPRLSAMC